METGRCNFPLEYAIRNNNNNNNNNTWEQFFSNLLNIPQSTSHEGSEVYTAEPDIPEPSLIEVELAIEKLKKQ